MKIRWLGHASFLITASEPAVKIITDPYEPNYHNMINYGPVEDEADIVTVSHDHGDHNYVAGIKGNPQVVKELGKHQAKGVNFTGVASYHDATKGAERGQNTIFCFTVDNIRCCHMGDLGHTLSDEQIAQIGPVDVILMPCGGGPTLELDEAIALGEKMKPKVIIPMHIKTDKCAFPKYGVDEILAKRPAARRMWGPDIDYPARFRLPTYLQFLILSPAL